ncbi:MAG: radical SAM family heme chaperone HemW, partial [Gammaproteobacteria bacterium]
RRCEGFAWPEFEARTGCARETVREAIGGAIADGLLTSAGERVAAGSRGLRFLNELQARFLPA